MSDLSKGAAFIDGNYLPVAEASIPVLDWGFLHSDATYDVAHVWHGRFFRIDDYLDRFHRGMVNLRMSVAYSRDEIRAVMFELVRRSGLRDAYVEIVCTRGMPAPGSRDPRSCENRFFAFAIPFVWIANEQLRERGMNLLISSRQRIPPESVESAYQELSLAGHGDGPVRGIRCQRRQRRAHRWRGKPGGRAGVQCLSPACGERVITPARGVLEGVTRATVLELLARRGYSGQRGHSASGKRAWRPTKSLLPAPRAALCR